MKRFVSLILSVCFLFSINTVSYAANACNGQHHIPGEGFDHSENARFKTGWFGADLLCDVAHLGVDVIKQAGEIGHDRRCQQ